MPAVGDYISAIRDRLVALHVADAAWASDGVERTKVRGANVVARDGTARQNVKRAAGFPAQPGDLPLADFRFSRLGPGPLQQSPLGTMKTFGNAAPDGGCGGVFVQSLVYRVQYKALTEPVATALLVASQRIVTAARNQLSGTDLPALSYVTGAAVVSAVCVERVENKTLLTVLDSDVAVNVRLTTADIIG